MADAQARRVSVADARRKLKEANPPLLVCIYPNDKYAEVNLEGSIGMEAFDTMKPTLSRDREIIFY